MKKILYILALIATTFANAQNIIPTADTELCPGQEYTFSVNLPASFNSMSSSIGATITQYPTGSSSSISFKGIFLETTSPKVFTFNYGQGGSYVVAFTKIKSLFGGYKQSGSVPISLTFPICQTTPVQLNISGEQYWDSYQNPFGTINTYKYLIPSGWSLNSTLSNGTTWITASGNITITPTANTGNGNTIKYVAKSDCSSAFFEGNEKSITINRFIPTFTISPSSLTFTCGTPKTQTFTVSASNSTSCSTTYNWNLGANNGWLYNGSPAPASFSTPTNSITLTSANGNVLPSSVNVTPILNGNGLSQLTCTTSFTPFTSNSSLSGPDSICPTSIQATYSLSSLEVGLTTSWSLSNPQMGTILSSNNTQATVRGYQNGSVTLIATISNGCNQKVVRTKTINVIATTSGIVAPISYVTDTNFLRYCINPQNSNTCGFQSKTIVSTANSLKPINFDISLQLGNAYIQQLITPVAYNSSSGQTLYSGDIYGKFYSSPIVVSVKANYPCNVSSGNFVTYMSLMGVANKMSQTNNSYEIKISPNKAKDFVVIAKEDFDIPYLKVVTKYLNREVSDAELGIMKEEITALENSIKEKVIVKLFDFNSKEVLTTEMTTNELELNVSKFTKGLYIITVERGIEKVTQKLVIE